MTSRIWYRPSEVAEAYGVTTVRVHRWLLSGEMAGRKIGRLWFVHRSVVEDYHAIGAQSQRGLPIPALEGRSLGRVRDDGGRAPAVSVSRTKERRLGAAPGTAEAAGRRGAGRSAPHPAWTLPTDVAD